jgi:peptide/nickel transport system ATP-binding protein
MAMTASPDRVLDAEALRVELASGFPVIDEVSLQLSRGEILGLVGESGSGKTTTALALLGYSRPGSVITGGQVTIAGQSVLDLPDAARRRLRGRLVSYVPQHAGQALNPSLRISAAISDVMRQHETRSRADVMAVLAAVDLPASQAFARRLPHQLSGGQQQRVTIAMALSCEPPLIVMDEPTTGLDVITQASVLEEIRRLREQIGAALVYVSHDLAVISELADRIAVMYAGRIVEEGPAATLLARPRHPYTRGLVQSIPDHRRPTRQVAMPGIAAGVEDRPAGCAFAPRCIQQTPVCSEAMPALIALTAGHQVRCVHADETPPVTLGEERDLRAAARPSPVLEVTGLRATHRSGSETVVAADDVSFELGGGECLALVGESGSGKTTIARCLAGLHRPDRGVISLHGDPLPDRARKRSLAQRRAIQYVFQNPYESLNPRRQVSDELARPAQVLRGLSASAARAEVGALLDRVRLPARAAGRYPSQLSGGERQRVAIARALAAEPEILICDEITSSLDVSVQAAVLGLLADLRAELGLSVLLITHDLGVVSVTADRVLVLQQGTMRETGSITQILHTPAHPYTRQLIAAAPVLPVPVTESGDGQGKRRAISKEAAL